MPALEKSLGSFLKCAAKERKQWREKCGTTSSAWVCAGAFAPGPGASGVFFARVYGALPFITAGHAKTVSRWQAAVTRPPDEQRARVRPTCSSSSSGRRQGVLFQPGKDLFVDNVRGARSPRHEACSERKEGPRQRYLHEKQ
ncbi:hypothetical protein MRX96_025257 [Rhipicephalus microplus]